ncbi:hypothetical protein OEZ85_008946 [Tetradesmus obliquus]|uniref:AMP-dependent synthetase/ligase domain-containing protein n=1 Tax=Tetradesmus obliquus TaxID=3088 RepID=A0ABY8TKA1_TETOB|nr:hypothetical protein OEZ85_008946 [Tetradesmus obliquus]
MGTEQGFLNRYTWMQQQQQQQQTVPLQPGHVVAFKTSVGFVDHVWELLAPLLSEADMLLLPDAAAAAAARDAGEDDGTTAGQQQQQQQQQGVGRPQASLLLQPEALVQLLVQYKVTHLAAVPSVLQLWLPALAAARQQLSLLQLVSSGEMLPTALAGNLLQALPERCLLLNLYGSTEVSADATCQLVSSSLLASMQGPWLPAGQPIANLMMAVGRSSSSSSSSKNGRMRELLVPLPVGYEGEVWVAGPGLAAGYLPQQTPIVVHSVQVRH